MSEQQRKQEQRDRYYAFLAEKAKLSMTYVTNLSPASHSGSGAETLAASANTFGGNDGPGAPHFAQHAQIVAPSHALYSDNIRPVQGHQIIQQAPLTQPSGPHAEMNAAAEFHTAALAPQQFDSLVSEMNRLKLKKNKADENAKYWNEISQNADRQHIVLAKDRAALEQKVMTLERQVKEEQNAKLALKRRLDEYREPQGRSSLTETLDLKESELLNLQGKMKELRFHNSALKSQIEELRHEKGPQTDLELAREVQHLRSEVERLSTQNEILQKQLANQEIRSHELWSLQEGASDKDDPYALLDTAFK